MLLAPVNVSPKVSSVTENGQIEIQLGGMKGRISTSSRFEIKRPGKKPRILDRATRKVHTKDKPIPVVLTGINIKTGELVFSSSVLSA